MGRIRTTKPEFHSHEDLSALPPETHLLASALLNYADDFGYFNAHPVLVKAGTNPLRNDSTPIEEMLHQLAKIGYIVIAKRGDKCFGRIVNFDTHQRVAHPTASKLKAKFEELPIISGGTLELFTPEQGTGNRELNREQGCTVPDPTQENRQPTAASVILNSPTANADIATLVERIILAHPRSLMRKARWGESSHAQHTAVLRAMDDEMTARNLSAIDALEVILCETEQYAQGRPSADYQFVPEIDKFFRQHEYRIDPVYLNREDRTNGANSKQTGRVDAATERQQTSRNAIADAVQRRYGGGVGPVDGAGAIHETQPDTPPGNPRYVPPGVGGDRNGVRNGAVRGRTVEGTP